MNPGFAERTVDPLTIFVPLGAIALYCLLPFLYFRTVMARSGLIGRTHRYNPFLEEGPAGGLEVPTDEERRFVRRHTLITQAMTVVGFICIMLMFGLHERGV